MWQSKIEYFIVLIFMQKYLVNNVSLNNNKDIVVDGYPFLPKTVFVFQIYHMR
jgi:hypothetical protein